MLFSIDRVEGDLAVLCDESGRTCPVPLASLPAGAAAGDMLRQTPEGYEPAPQAAAARRERVRALQSRLQNAAPFVSAVVPAAGSATRMGGEKQRLLLRGVPVLARTLQALEAADCIREIVLVAREADIEEFSGWADRYGISKLTRVTAGGDTRQQSVERGLKAVDPRASLVAIHDGARPLITPGEIAALVEEAARHGAAAACTPVKDTVKITADGATVASTPDRVSLRAVQTPQVFRRDLYEAALAAAQAAGRDFTDDCQLFEFAGHPVRLVSTGYRNIKITTPEDMAVAAALLGGEELVMRIGHGYDVHRLVEGRRLILGGVEIPFEKGLLGHSDADVLTHAVMDALLGAAALGDIGVWFPDTDDRWRGADSIALLRQVTGILQEQGFRPQNIDATLLAQTPRLRPYIDGMRQNIAAACGLAVEAVSVKATTEEKLGFTGAGEGMAAHAVCIIKKEV